MKPYAIHNVFFALCGVKVNATFQSSCSAQKEPLLKRHSSYFPKGLLTQCDMAKTVWCSYMGIGSLLNLFAKVSAEFSSQSLNGSLSATHSDAFEYNEAGIPTNSQKIHTLN